MNADPVVLLWSAVAAMLLCASGAGVQRTSAAVTDFSSDPPEGIKTDTYRQLATATTQTGQTAQIFTGRFERDKLGCVGLRTSEFIGMACGVNLRGEVPLQAHETTYLGHTMVSGLVSTEVAAVWITDRRGRDVFRVPIENGTFFFDRGWGESVIAYDDVGRIVGGYELR